MWALQSGGMTNWEVLRAATIHGAEALGYAQDIGSLEPGKLADLIVLRKDPLTDIRNTNTIRYVMKNGELFGAIDSTGREVLPIRYKAVQHLAPGLLIVSGDSGTGVFDHKGTELLPLEYTEISLVAPGIVKVAQEGRLGYVRLSDRRFIWREAAKESEQAPVPVSEPASAE
jgi:hypothetical protein